MKVNPIFIILNLIFAGASWLTYDDHGDFWWGIPLGIWLGYLGFAIYCEIEAEEAQRKAARRRGVRR